MAGETVERIAVGSGAEALLEQIKAQGGVRYVFANTGTDHGPIIEALAKSAKEDPREMRALVVPHEMAAVSMAHGYYNVTGNPQVVLVHTLPGTANALGGLFNAHSEKVPLVLLAGRTPVTEGELAGGKSRNIHWRQESRDQGSIVREFVKWDFEVRSNANLPTVVSRAFKIALTEPRGPVYLVLPREWLCEPLQSTTILKNAFRPASKIQADESVLEEVAELLGAAENPLIVTKYLGRNPEAVSSLVELAEQLAIPVVQHPQYMNFPTDHPFYLGTQTARYAKDADVIFLIDVDVPWNTVSREFLKPGVKIIHLERDPLFSSVPIWGFSADLAVSGCSEISLPVLNRLVTEKLQGKPSAGRTAAERAGKVRALHDAMIRERDRAIDAVKNQRPIDPLWLSKCIGDVMDDDTIIISETVTSPLSEVIPCNKPGSLFGTPAAGHLGWGLGAAIGAKLGAPDKTVIAAEGDGAYIFSEPTACHFTAQKYQIPFLTVVYNNQAWNASANTVRELYPEGVAQKTGNYPGCDLTPSPKFELIAEACGAYSERVEDPGDLPAALGRALKALKEERRQALLHVICKSAI